MRGEPSSTVSLATYATLLAHLRYFPKDTHAEVLERLDFDPAAWPDYAKRAEAQLARAVKRGEATPEFDDIFGELRRTLKKRKPAVADLPLDADKPIGGAGPARSVRLRDIDPVQFLEILSARLPRIHVVPHGADPASSPGDRGPRQPAPAPPRTVPRPAAAFPEAAPLPDATNRGAGTEDVAAEDVAAQARRRSQAARARFESTQVSPSSPSAAPHDAPLNVTLQVPQGHFPAATSEPSEPLHVAAPQAEPQAEAQVAEPTFGGETSGLSLFEFSNLCAEYNQCPEHAREQVRMKYGIQSEADRLDLLDRWRERLVDNNDELAEWRKLYDAAMRHWHHIYKGHEA